MGRDFGVAVKEELKPKFIYITGADGTGKTTQASLLVEYFRSQGIEAQSLWMRFSLLFSLPFLAFARIRGYTWYEVRDGIRQGYWDFQQSWIMRRIFPWIYLLDGAIASLLFARLPLLMGHTIVCERFVLDMLADLMVALGDENIVGEKVGSMFLQLLPKGTVVMVLDLGSNEIRSRRLDLQIDRKLDSRLKAYKRIIQVGGFNRIPAHDGIREVQKIIRDQLGIG